MTRYHSNFVMNVRTLDCNENKLIARDTKAVAPTAQSTASAE